MYSYLLFELVMEWKLRKPDLHKLLQFNVDHGPPTFILAKNWQYCASGFSTNRVFLSMLCVTQILSSIMVSFIGGFPLSFTEEDESVAASICFGSASVSADFMVISDIGLHGYLKPIASAYLNQL